MGNIVINGLIGVEGGADFVVDRRVDIGVVTSDSFPSSGVVIGHKVPEVNILVHS